MIGINTLVIALFQLVRMFYQCIAHRLLGWRTKGFGGQTEGFHLNVEDRSKNFAVGSGSNYGCVTRRVSKGEYHQ